MSNENVSDLFPPDKPFADPLAGIYRENASRRLAVLACPKCGVTGKLALFEKIPHTHIGITCLGCGRDHPFGTRWIGTISNAWKKGKL